MFRPPWSSKIWNLRLANAIFRVLDEIPWRRYLEKMLSNLLFDPYSISNLSQTFGPLESFLQVRFCIFLNLEFSVFVRKWVSCCCPFQEDSWNLFTESSKIADNECHWGLLDKTFFLVAVSWKSDCFQALRCERKRFWFLHLGHWFRTHFKISYTWNFEHTESKDRTPSRCFRELHIFAQHTQTFDLYLLITYQE
jgi:hypothetical protein